jgi:RNA polymerase sigma-70 factor (ECF subfamily)
VATYTDPWIDALRSDGSEREEAVERLHALLLRAARFEVNRRGFHAEADELASQAASDAAMTILSKLDDFRGESRFTTWAYKFALLEAAVKCRRRAWRDREVPLEGMAERRLLDDRLGTEASVESAELLRAVRTAIEEELTPHQRHVLVSVTLGDVPIDVLAERLETTRGALYKTLHDARRKLRASLGGEWM